MGLAYLTLARSASTLSGGEAQRIRLATQIGSRLTGVLYVLDEPSIGLHQRDNNKLIHSLQEMRDLGNTLVVVEHDTDTMLASDYLVDIGPEAGDRGGCVMAMGTPEEVMQNEKSQTSPKQNRFVNYKQRERNWNDIEKLARERLKNSSSDFEFALGKDGHILRDENNNPIKIYPNQELPSIVKK